MRNKIVLRITSVAAAALFCAVWSLVGCKATGSADDEDINDYTDYAPVAMPLASMSVEDSSGKNYLTGFHQNKTEYQITFKTEQKDTPLVIKAKAVSESAKVIIKIGASVHSESGELSTAVPESILRALILVNEGGAGTEYEILIYTGEAAANSNELSGYVTITGNVEIGEKLSAELSYDYNEREANTMYSWFRDGEKVSSKEGRSGAVYTVVSDDDDAVIKVEVTSSEKSGVLSASRSAPEWVDMSKVQDIIEKANQLIGGLKPIVGDSAKNPLSLMRISGLIGELNTLKKGVQHTREVTNSSGGTDTEVYTVYDRAALGAKSDELDELLKTSSGITNIIVRELVFEYTGSDQTVKLMGNNDAVYQIELTGASGGHIYTEGGGTEAGGRGAYVVARYNLVKGTEYTIRVGGQGTGTAQWNDINQKFEQTDGNYNSSKPGGWPNGGIGSESRGHAGGSGGGGSTDIVLSSKKSSSYSGNLSDDPRFAVAAGGGGAAKRAHSQGAGSAIRGGNAGEDGLVVGAASNSDPITIIEAATQRPTSGESSKGEYGEDGSRTDSTFWEGPGGGGGGFKGGEAVTNGTYKGNKNVHGSGAGGSSYIKKDGSHIDGFDVTEVYPAYGNGQAVVTWIRN